MTETKRLALKVLASDKAGLERKAQAEGEPVAVIVRRAIRRELRDDGTTNENKGEPEPAQAAQP
jgi:hypothetical protein